MKYASHPSIKNINETINKSSFTFRNTSIAETKEVIQNLKCNVTNPSGSVTSSHLKDNLELSSELLSSIINFGISNSTFDNDMKLADITPIHKSDDPTNKENYRPISILASGSKVFENIF